MTTCKHWIFAGALALGALIQPATAEDKPFHVFNMEVPAELSTLLTSKEYAVHMAKNMDRLDGYTYVGEMRVGSMNVRESVEGVRFADVTLEYSKRVRWDNSKRTEWMPWADIVGVFEGRVQEGGTPILEAVYTKPAKGNPHLP